MKNNINEDYLPFFPSPSEDLFEPESNVNIKELDMKMKEITKWEIVDSEEEVYMDDVREAPEEFSLNESHESNESNEPHESHEPHESYESYESHESHESYKYPQEGNREMAITRSNVVYNNKNPQKSPNLGYHWTNEESNRLMHAMLHENIANCPKEATKKGTKVDSFPKGTWPKIAMLMGGDKTPRQCKSRWQKLTKFKYLLLFHDRDRMANTLTALTHFDLQLLGGKVNGFQSIMKDLVDSLTQSTIIK